MVNVPLGINSPARHEVHAGRLTVWVSYKTGQVGVGQVTLAVPTDRFDILLDEARQCLRRARVPRVAASRMHLIAEHLTPRASAPLGLFEPPSDRAERIARVKREINARHGRFALRSAATLPLVDVYRDAAQGYDICDVHGKMCF